MRKASFAGLTRLYSFEYSTAKETFCVKWHELHSDKGEVRHSVTVYRFDLNSDKVSEPKWVEISEPLIIEKWKPTDKRSYNLLIHFL